MCRPNETSRGQTRTSETELDFLQKPTGILNSVTFNTPMLLPIPK